MSGSSYAEEYGAGGPSDDGVAAGAWRAFHRLDGARAEFSEAIREERTSAILRALLAPLGTPEGGGGR